MKSMSLLRRRLQHQKLLHRPIKPDAPSINPVRVRPIAVPVTIMRLNIPRSNQFSS